VHETTVIAHVQGETPPMVGFRTIRRICGITMATPMAEPR
jgi:hypothetical protein